MLETYCTSSQKIMTIVASTTPTSSTLLTLRVEMSLLSGKELVLMSLSKLKTLSVISTKTKVSHVSLAKLNGEDTCH